MTYLTFNMQKHKWTAFATSASESCSSPQLQESEQHRASLQEQVKMLKCHVDSKSHIAAEEEFSWEAMKQVGGHARAPSPCPPAISV